VNIIGTSGKRSEMVTCLITVPLVGQTKRMATKVKENSIMNMQRHGMNLSTMNRNQTCQQTYN
jgi:hypothetical protein